MTNGALAISKVVSWTIPETQREVFTYTLTHPKGYTSVCVQNIGHRLPSLLEDYILEFDEEGTDYKLVELNLPYIDTQTGIHDQILSATFSKFCPDSLDITIKIEMDFSRVSPDSRKGFKDIWEIIHNSGTTGLSLRIYGHDEEDLLCTH